MPLKGAVSNLEAFHKERERSTDRLLDEPNPEIAREPDRARPHLLHPVVGERLDTAQKLLAAAEQPATDRDALDRLGARLNFVAARVAEEEKAAAALTPSLEKLPRAATEEPTLADSIAAR